MDKSPKSVHVKNKTNEKTWINLQKASM